MSRLRPGTGVAGPGAIVYSLTMQSEANIVPQCAAAPGSLGGLLTLYESNFIKLRGLLPGLESLRGDYRSASARDLPLHLAVVPGSRYTLDATLTYHFDGTAGPIADPDLRLRVYFDARMVEVVGWSGAPRHRELRRLGRAAAREIDVRWARNAMLAKWLDYLRDHAHAFTPAAARGAAAPRGPARTVD
jgi:uncharacterized protein